MLIPHRPRSLCLKKYQIKCFFTCKMNRTKTTKPKQIKIFVSGTEKLTSYVVKHIGPNGPLQF